MTITLTVLDRQAHPLLASGRGWPVEHPYVECCWAPRLGPTGVLLVRRAAELTRDGPVRLPLEELASALGVKPAVLARTMRRVTSFRLGHAEGLELAPPGPVRFSVYDRVPSLGVAQLGHVGTLACSWHHRFTAQAVASTPASRPSPVVSEPGGRGTPAPAPLTARLDPAGAAAATTGPTRPPLPKHLVPSSPPAALGL